MRGFSRLEELHCRFTDIFCKSVPYIYGKVTFFRIIT